MTCKITGFNAHGFLRLGVHKGPDVLHTSHWFATFRKTHRQFCGWNYASNVRQRFQGFVQETKGAQIEVQ
jgi:predicted FMN-binding regulatory protein PaiB